MNTQELSIIQQTVKINADGLICIKPICTYFGLDWSNQQRLIKNDIILNKQKHLLKAKSENGKQFKMVHFDRKAFVRWVQIISYKTVTESLKSDFINFQMNIIDYIYGDINSKDLSVQQFQKVKELKKIKKSIDLDIKQLELRIANYLEHTAEIHNSLQLLT